MDHSIEFLTDADVDKFIASARSLIYKLHPLAGKAEKDLAWQKFREAEFWLKNSIAVGKLEIEIEQKLSAA